MQSELAPPETPGGRILVAELASSMLLAAPLTAILSLPAAAALDIEPSRDPQQIALLFGIGLIGTWAALASNKWAEARTLDKSPRRLLALAAGLVVAGCGIWLAQTLKPVHMPQRHAYLDHNPDAIPLAFFAYFAILFAVARGWPGLTARDRPRRFRFRPVLYSAILALLLTPLWPNRRADGVLAAVMITVALQLTSPWSQEAADYTKLARSQRKRAKKSRAA